MLHLMRAARSARRRVTPGKRKTRTHLNADSVSPLMLHTRTKISSLAPHVTTYVSAAPVAPCVSPERVGTCA